MSRLQERYRNEIAPKLQEEFGFKSAMQIPRITKITLNMGLGEAVANKNVLQNAASDLEKITGQKPVKSSKQGQFQIIDIVDMMRPLCKYTRQFLLFR